MDPGRVSVDPARARSDPGQSVGDPIVNPGRIAQLALAAVRGISQLSCALGAQLELRYQPINRAIYRTSYLHYIYRQIYRTPRSVRYICRCSWRYRATDIPLDRSAGKLRAIRFTSRLATSSAASPILGPIGHSEGPTFLGRTELSVLRVRGTTFVRVHQEAPFYSFLFLLV